MVAGMPIGESLGNMEQPEGKTPASIYGPGYEANIATFPPSSNRFLQGGVLLEQLNVGQAQRNMRLEDSASSQGTAPVHPASIRNPSLVAGKTPVFIAQWSPLQDMGLGGSTPRLPCRPVSDSGAPMIRATTESSSIADDGKAKPDSSSSSSSTGSSTGSRSIGYNSLRESMGETPRLPTRQSADSQFCGGNSSSPSSCPSVDGDDRSSLGSDVGSPDFGRGQEWEGSIVEADALLSLTCFSASAMARHVPPLQIAAIPQTSNSPAHSLRMLMEGSMTDGGLERDMESRLEELAREGSELDKALKSLKEAMSRRGGSTPEDTGTIQDGCCGARCVCREGGPMASQLLQECIECAKELQEECSKHAIALHDGSSACPTSSSSCCPSATSECDSPRFITMWSQRMGMGAGDVMLSPGRGGRCAAYRRQLQTAANEVSTANQEIERLKHELALERERAKDAGKKPSPLTPPGMPPCDGRASRRNASIDKDLREDAKRSTSSSSRSDAPGAGVCV